MKLLSCGFSARNRLNCANVELWWATVNSSKVGIVCSKNPESSVWQKNNWRHRMFGKHFLNSAYETPNRPWLKLIFFKFGNVVRITSADWTLLNVSSHKVSPQFSMIERWINSLDKTSNRSNVTRKLVMTLLNDFKIVGNLL